MIAITTKSSTSVKPRHSLWVLEARLEGLWDVAMNYL
jgi:hypothetical protein